MKTGDVVVLKSGGPKMTISPASSGSYMAVTWWDPETKKYVNGTYHVEMLMLTNPEELVSYLGKKEVVALCGISMSTLDRVINVKHVNYDPTFPKPHYTHTGSRRVRFIRSEVVAWYNAQKPVKAVA